MYVWWPFVLSATLYHRTANVRSFIFIPAVNLSTLRMYCRTILSSFPWHCSYVEKHTLFLIISVCHGWVDEVGISVCTLWVDTHQFENLYKLKLPADRYHGQHKPNVWTLICFPQFQWTIKYKEFLNLWQCKNSLTGERIIQLWCTKCRHRQKLFVRRDN